MESPSIVVPRAAPKLVPFICPVCKAPNAVGLIALVRAGGTTCVGCRRQLSANDVSRAMHAPRTVG